MGKQVEVLKHHADLATNRFYMTQIVGDFSTVNNDLTFLMLFKPVDASNERGLSRARRSAHNDTLALSDIQIDIAQHMELAVPLVDIFHADDGVSHTYSPEIGCAQRLARSP